MRLIKKIYQYIIWIEKEKIKLAVKAGTSTNLF
jgi:hypothetical protein